MVGDSAEDDVRGADAYGCGAVLRDRFGRAADARVPRIESLAELPAALGLGSAAPGLRPASPPR
jgi:FMN phosphatase YigB (HAD superfamily)